MLSLVLYGRNDNHGYNLHKRAAISLNAMAEVLSEADDEILFVDYNTPDDLPTFPEAISDTLTDRAKEKLRVLRVRPVLHEQFRLRTHLNALESISRNIATRRSNPNNRWVLSTNTDMIFVPHEPRESLTDIVRDLPDAFYQLPRMELPEVLWESFDRRDGAGMIERTREWAKRFHLNEIVKGSDDILFDGPGDFQLCLRRDLFEMHGFHEGMLRGWHVDANLCVRMLKRHGRIEGLTHKLFAYHCDHTRQATPSHTHDRLENSADEFISRVREPGLPEQAANWGLPDEEIEEVRLGKADVFSRYLSGLEVAIPEAQSEVYESAYRAETYGRLAYRRAHVLPFVMDLVAPFPRRTQVLYAGARADMFEDFVRAHAAIAGDAPILVPDTIDWLPDFSKTRRLPLDEAVRLADLLIFEFGTGEQELTPNQDQRRRLSAVRRAFVAAATEEQRRVEAGGSRRRVVAINAIHNEFEALVGNHVAFTLTPFASRVRHGYFLLESVSGEQGFDVRAVWRDVGNAIGRSRAIPLSEGQELARLAGEAAAVPPGAPLSTEALGCAEPLIELLRHRRVEQAAGVRTDAALALAARLEAERPSRQLARIVRAPRAQDRVAITRVADNSDWERPAFARFVANHFGGASAYGFTERNLWTWERAAILDVLLAAGALAPKAKALVISTVPDLFSPALADYVGEVRLANVAAEQSAQDLIVPARADDSPFSAGFASWSSDANEKFDLVVVIQHALMAHGPRKMCDALVEASELLNDGGFLALSADVSLVGLSAPHEIAATRLASGEVARALEGGSGFALCGPTDVDISAATADRAHPHRRSDLKHRELVTVRAGGRVVTEGVITLRRVQTLASHEERARRVERALFGDTLQQAPGVILQRAKPVAARAIGWAWRSSRFAPVLRQMDSRWTGTLANLPLWSGAPSEWANKLAAHQHVVVADGRFTIEAGSPDGHAVFGPYLPIDSGQWILRFRAKSTGADGRLVIDVTQAEAVIAERAFAASQLDGCELSVTFETLSNTLYRLARNVQLLEVQTRFAVYGGAEMEIWDVALSRDDQTAASPVVQRDEKTSASAS